VFFSWAFGGWFLPFGGPFPPGRAESGRIRGPAPGTCADIRGVAILKPYPTSLFLLVCGPNPFPLLEDVGSTRGEWLLMTARSSRLVPCINISRSVSQITRPGCVSPYIASSYVYSKTTASQRAAADSRQVSIMALLLQPVVLPLVTDALGPQPVDTKC